MDDNVMNRYLTTAEEPREFIQYDQGEDRWLCTLLIQQGYRVEYCAGSDALTFAPEKITEYFTQQRRWITSTMANVLDLIGSYKTTVEKNRDISYFFMLYQTILFLASLLSPATIIMLIAGSYNAILGTPLLHSYLLGISAALFYTLVCLFIKNDLQIMVGIMLSAIYAVVMMLVVVALIVNSSYESIVSPNVAFLTAITVLFLVAALLHPRELLCLVPGLLYIFAIPFSSLFLIIYSIANMNVVSWGTREVPRAKTKEEIEQEEQEELERKERAKNSGILNLLGLGGVMRDMKEFYRTMLNKNTTDSNSQLNEISERMKTLEVVLKEVVTDKKTPRNELRELLEARHASIPEVKVEVPKKREKKRPPPPPSTVSTEIEDPKNPFWLQEDVISKGKLRLIDNKEGDFWKQMLKRYLHPIDSDKRKEKAQADALKEMRNNVVIGLSMLNVMWTILIFLFQTLKETLGEALFIPIPQDEGRIEFFEPVGLVFLSFFAVLLTVQFLATLWHRLVTIMHLIAVTIIRWPCGKSADTTLEDAIILAGKLQSLRPTDELAFCEPHPDYEDDVPAADYDKEAREDQQSQYSRLASLPRPPHHHEPRGFYPSRVHREHERLDQFGVPMDSDSFYDQSARRRPGRTVRHRYPGVGVRDISGGTLRHNFNRRFARLNRYATRRETDDGRVPSQFLNVLHNIERRGRHDHERYDENQQFGR